MAENGRTPLIPRNQYRWRKNQTKPGMQSWSLAEPTTIEAANGGTGAVAHGVSPVK